MLCRAPRGRVNFDPIARGQKHNFVEVLARLKLSGPASEVRRTYRELLPEFDGRCFMVQSHYEECHAGLHRFPKSLRLRVRRQSQSP